MGGFIGMFLARSPADFAAIRQDFAARLKHVELPDPYKMCAARGRHPLDSVARDFIARARPHVRPRRAGSWSFWRSRRCLFMLLPALNLVNLNVSRILERASEIGVRKAFGASSGTLVGQFLVENVALTLVGGPSPWLSLRFILPARLPAEPRPLRRLSRSTTASSLYALALAVVFGVLSGAYPAWKMSRLHPVEALKGGSR